MIVKYRIKKYSEFENVIDNGQLIRSDSFTFYVLKNDLGFTRIGISVPKKTGNAVIRNRIKRQVRSACGQATNFSKSIDLVIIVRKGYSIENFVGIKQEIQKLFEK